MESKRRLGLIGIALLIGAIVASIPAMAEARTIQVVNLLLQNLHDVFISNPTSGQVLSYNGTYWINANATGGESTVCANVGAGSNVYKDGNCNFRSLLSGDTNSLTLTQNTNDITFTPTLQKLCETVASGGETSLSCSFTSVKVLYINIAVSTSSSSTTWRLQFNSDTGNSYSYRSSSNGGADTSTTNSAGWTVYGAGSTPSQFYYTTLTCTNIISSTNKHCYGSYMFSANGAGTTDNRNELDIKWANTSANISSIQLTRTAGTGTFDANSQIIVMGYI